MPPHPVKPPTPTTSDAAIANEVRQRVAALNESVQIAVDNGLAVEFDDERIDDIRGRAVGVTLEVKISRPL